MGVQHSEGRPRDPDSFPEKIRLGAYPDDDLENVKVSLMEGSWSLFCAVRDDAKSKVHRRGFHGGGFGVFRGKVLTVTSGSWKVLIGSSVPLVGKI